MMTRLRVASVVLLLVIAGGDHSVIAGDYFLTIGGGYSPTGNQISLEKNVQLFQRLIGEHYPSGVQHDIYFSDGNNAGRDLQYADPDFEIPKANLLLAQVLRQSKYLKYRYRNHQISGVRGGSNRKNIQKWFSEVGSQLKPGDRLFVYVTAHGGSATNKKQDPYNTGLYAWNTQRLPMKEIAGYLDKIPAEVPVVTVMVQCYAGGFSNIIFNQGDSKKGFTKSNRCGFFATVHTRPAAGCTADIHEENYHEYSSYFWEAIRGKTRTDVPIKRPDYNGDGAVSYAEAHAYALLTSSTIDISVKTSDTFLRAFSKLSFPKPSAKSKSAPDKNKPVEAQRPRPVLLTADTPFPQLAALASPSERAVLDGLSEQLKLNGTQRGKGARSLAAKILTDKKKVDSEYKKKLGEYSRTALGIKKVLINRWPELSNRWHPDVMEILTKDAEELVKLIESHAKFARFEQLRGEVKKLSARKLDADKRWAKTQRLIRTLENVALAANLPKVASAEVGERYQQLLKAESASFGSVASVNSAVSAASGGK